MHGRGEKCIWRFISNTGSILKWILKDAMYSTDSGQGPVVGTSEHGNEQWI
jgi:hypothetical protein